MFSDLTLSHVAGEDGRPLRVTSLRQLREAEKKYKFRSWAANQDEKNFDKPPEAPSNRIADHLTKEKKWLFPETANAMLKEIERRGISPEEVLSGKRDLEWGVGR